MYSGSSARLDYQRRLELNTQDSDEDVLFRQEMNYPERGAGGFSILRRAGAGENRASPPVQQLDVSEYVTASKAGSERGRRRHQRIGPVSAVRMSAEASIRRIESLQGAGKKIPTHSQRGTPPWRRAPVGGRSGRQATHAAAAQCKRATASQGAAECTASQARREHAAAQTGSLRLPSERLRRIPAEATSGRLLRGASCSTSHGTWVEADTGHDKCHERHRQPGHPQLGQVWAECRLAVLRRYVQRLPGIQEEV
jgi:hypothetical protein